MIRHGRCVMDIIEDERTVAITMRVDSTYNAYKIFNATDNNRLHKASNAKQNSKDTFTLSLQAEDYQVARKAVSQVPDTRSERVNAIKSQIESGQYFINASAIADKILQNVPQ